MILLVTSSHTGVIQTDSHLPINLLEEKAHSLGSAHFSVTACHCYRYYLNTSPFEHPESDLKASVPHDM